MDGDAHLGRPTLVRAGAQPVADHLFPPPDGGLGSSAFVVPGPLLPSPAPVLGNALEMAVALRRRGLGIRRWHRARTRRHDDRRVGVARSGWWGGVSGSPDGTGLGGGGRQAVASGWQAEAVAEGAAWSYERWRVASVTGAGGWSSKASAGTASAASLRVSAEATMG